MTTPDITAEKRAAALAAVALVEDGMRVGLGTGTTVAELVPALGRRKLAITCAATSPATEELARAHGLDVRPFTDIDRLDLAIDGADQVDPAGWLVKGGGGAHTRERIVAAAADRFVVIVSSDKPVEHVHAPVPLELLAFGLAATLHALPGAVLRDAPRTPDGGVLADYHGEVGDPARLSQRLDAVAGLVSHGLFPPSMVATVFVARGDQVEARHIS
ncbi:MAG TPA: ribose 5-phosphate isomerase A [Acidimicrobiales bacterium]|nr:ribose 5-phosphate isomerase A [Acidimicrobiales bacterium]